MHFGAIARLVSALAVCNSASARSVLPQPPRTHRDLANRLEILVRFFARVVRALVGDASHTAAPAAARSSNDWLAKQWMSGNNLAAAQGLVSDVDIVPTTDTQRSKLAC